MFFVAMWGLFKKRQEGDLSRLVSAYRCFLKAASQADETGLLDEEERRTRAWKGGFGKAIHQLYMQWPSPNQSRRFARKMQYWLARSPDLDRAFVLAFNDYLQQKRLTEEELLDVIESGRDAFQR